MKRNSCTIKFLVFCSFCSAGFSAEAQTKSPDPSLTFQHRSGSSCNTDTAAACISSLSGDEAANTAVHSETTQLWPLTPSMALPVSVSHSKLCHSCSPGYSWSSTHPSLSQDVPDLEMPHKPEQLSPFSQHHPLNSALLQSIQNTQPTISAEGCTQLLTPNCFLIFPPINPHCLL